MLALSAESVERTSLLSDLRKEAAAGAPGFYAYDVWECERVAEGSATVALRMAEELGPRIRYATPVTAAEGRELGLRCDDVDGRALRIRGRRVRDPWRPGDVMAVGPLHGTHEPPFYVCGSDQWVCGYMEGAVRTGRGAARAALGG